MCLISWGKRTQKRDPQYKLFRGDFRGRKRGAKQAIFAHKKFSLLFFLPSWPASQFTVAFHGLRAFEKWGEYCFKSDDALSSEADSLSSARTRWVRLGTQIAGPDAGWEEPTEFSERTASFSLPSKKSGLKQVSHKLLQIICRLYRNDFLSNSKHLNRDR